MLSVLWSIVTIVLSMDSNLPDNLTELGKQAGKCYGILWCNHKYPGLEQDTVGSVGEPSEYNRRLNQYSLKMKEIKEKANLLQGLDLDAFNFAMEQAKKTYMQEIEKKIQKLQGNYGSLTFMMLSMRD